MSRLSKIAVAACLVLWSSGASAQSRPGAAILATATGDTVDDGLGGTFDRALRAEIDDRGAVETRGSVVLDLPDLQLALGCAGETPACLSAVAAEMAVRFLILPNLDRVGDEFAVGVGLFDTASPDTLQRAIRRVPADQAGQLLDVIGGMVDELFGAETDAGTTTEAPPNPRPSDDVTQPDPPAPVVESGGPDDGRTAAAVSVGVVGAALLGVGAGFGAASQDNATQYTEARLDTADDAANALARLRDAEDQATVANALFVTGAIVLTAGIVWAIVEQLSAGEPDAGSAQMNIAPWGSPDGGGLVVQGAL